jgi:hypothetical protein
MTYLQWISESEIRLAVGPQSLVEASRQSRLCTCLEQAWERDLQSAKKKKKKLPVFIGVARHGIGCSCTILRRSS